MSGLEEDVRWLVPLPAPDLVAWGEDTRPRQNVSTSDYGCQPVERP